MTLGMPWVRSIGNARELVVVSDSRLSGGQFWDANPKIIMLPRKDCVLSFAGSTSDGYPLMLQAYNAILIHPKALSGALDIAHLKGHLVRVFNRSREFISHLPNGAQYPDPAEAVFMLSGYSWRAKDFRIWKLYYDRHTRLFTFRPVSPWAGQEETTDKRIAFVGDDDVVAFAKVALVEKLRASDKLQSGDLNMEPFEVLRDILRSGRFPSVGGAPQVVKIYEHATATPFGVYWPDRQSNEVCALGRPLLAYETLEWGVFDPDEPLVPPKRSRRSPSIRTTSNGLEANTIA